MSPRGIVPWLRGRVYWARVPRVGASSVQRSLGTTDRDAADAICDFLMWARKVGINRPGFPFLMDRMADGAVPVLDAYRAYTEHRLEDFIRVVQHGETDTDLEPFVAKWQKELERIGVPVPRGRANYLRQVRLLIPAGRPCPRSTFTKQRIRAWLMDLKGVKQPNRHRAALSSFANFLVAEDVLPANPVLQIPMAKESAPRTLYLNQGEAKRLIAHMEGTHKRLHAFLLATGMEYSAAVRAFYPNDFTARSVLAQGTKTAHRARTCQVTDTWLWAWEIALEGKPSQGAPFRSVNYYAMRNALKKALQGAKLPPGYTTHDHRHTWAVQAIRDGLPLHVVAHQLGHRDPVMTLRVYGRFVPNTSDFRVNTPVTATVPVERAVVEDA